MRRLFRVNGITECMYRDTSIMQKTRIPGLKTRCKILLNDITHVFSLLSFSFPFFSELIHFRCVKMGSQCWANNFNRSIVILFFLSFFFIFRRIKNWSNEIRFIVVNCWHFVPCWVHSSNERKSGKLSRKKFYVTILTATFTSSL